MTASLNPVKENSQKNKKKKATFNTLTVSKVRPLTDNAVEVSFDIPEELQDDYDYIPGQYVALRAMIDGQEHRRSYSICDVPRPGRLRVAIKRDRGGIFSTWANDTLEAGTQIDVMNPQGAFVSKTHLTGLNNPEVIREEISKIDNPHLVAIAAGSGITPIMAIAQTVLSESEDSTFE
ncbi:FAD-binding oxidoreductase, partial [Corynebacterium casei]